MIDSRLAEIRFPITSPTMGTGTKRAINSPRKLWQKPYNIGTKIEDRSSARHWLQINRDWVIRFNARARRAVGRHVVGPGAPATVQFAVEKPRYAAHPEPPVDQ